MPRYLSGRWLGLVLIGMSLVSMKALFHPGFYTSHDGWHLVARLYHYTEAVSAGQFPPRYSFNLLNGFGYPLFTFSYHLPWLLAQPLLFFGVSIFDAIKTIFILGFILSGLTMFYWLRRQFDALSGFVGAFIFLWAPYRFANILVRAALGEATGFLFLPLFFLGLGGHLASKKTTTLIIGAIGLAGVILSHSMMLYILIVPVTVYGFVSLYLQKKFRLRSMIYWLKLSALGVSLAGFYILPALYYKDSTIFNDVRRLFFQQQFVSLRQLFYMPWGYSASFTGPGEMSLQLGIAQWLIFAISLIVCAWLIFRKARVQQNQLILFVVGGLSFILAVFMMQSVSKPLWQQLSGWLTIDFPWRFLTLVVFSSALLISFITYHLPRPYKYGLVLLVLGVGIYANRNHLRVNQYTQIPLSLYVASEKTTNTFDEYLPRYVSSGEVRNEGRQPFNVDTRKAVVTDYQQSVNKISFEFAATTPADFQINTVYFPGMHLYINNQEQAIEYKKTGFPQFQLPAGSGTVRLIFKDNLPGVIGNGLTLAALLFVCWLLIRRNYEKSN